MTPRELNLLADTLHDAIRAYLRGNEPVGYALFLYPHQGNGAVAFRGLDLDDMNAKQLQRVLRGQLKRFENGKPNTKELPP